MEKMNKEIRDKLLSLKEDEIARLYKNVFSSEDGRLVLEDLRNRCFSYFPTVNHEDSVHANEVIYKEGKRSVVLHIETNLNHQPERNE